MDRSLSSHSMDNVLDNLLFKAAQFPRTDSEDQFRKFLERIPSTTNLASQGSMQSLPQAQQEQLQQQMAQIQQIQQHSLQLASSGAPISAQLPEGGSLNVGGIPRVPSLDLLRQLVTQQQQQMQKDEESKRSYSKSPGSTPVKEEPMSKAAGSTNPDIAGTSSEPAVGPLSSSPGTTLPMAIGGLGTPLQTQLPPAGAVPATLQVGSAHFQSVNSKKSDGLHATTRDSKAEVRRARRMLSNRESARRSRRRKQEHLSLLEEQISQLEDERDQLQAQVEKLEKQNASHLEQSSVLRRENDDLRRQLGLEGKEKHRMPGSPHKKQCNGH